MKRIVILGGGTGGTLVANRLRRELDEGEASIVVVDRDDTPRLPAGPAVRPLRDAEPRGHRPAARTRSSHDGIAFHQTEIEASRPRRGRGAPRRRHDPGLRRARRRQRRPAPARGDRGPDRHRLERARVHVLRPRGRHRARRARSSASTAAGSWSTSSTCRSSAPSRRSSSRSWPTGSCASAASATAPRSRTRRPLDGAVHEARVHGRARHLLAEKDIRVETEFATGEVDGEGGRLVCVRRARGPVRPARDDPAPRRRGVRRALAGARRRPGLRARPTRTPCRPRRGRTSSRSATRRSLPTSKAGSVTHFEGEVLTENVRRFLAGRAARGRLSTVTPTASSRPASTRRC